MSAKRAALSSICILVLALGGCGLLNRQFGVQVSVEPLGSGEVDPGGGTYHAGEQVTFSAAPASGFVFDKWENASTQNPRELLVASDVSITAHFVRATTDEDGTDGGDDAGASSGVPSTPANLRIGDPTRTSLKVSWDAAENATGYQVFRGTAALGQYVDTAYDGAGTTFTDTDLASGSTYYYKASAKNTDGTSPLSDYAAGTTTPPDATPPPDTTPPPAPTVSAATPTMDTTPEWTWSAVVDAAIYRYQLDSLGTAWTETTELHFAPAEPLADGEHAFYLQAADAAGNWSESAGCILTIITQPPGSPTGIVVSGPTASSLTISWAAAGPFTTYEACRDAGPSGTFGDIRYSGGNASFTDTPLDGGTTYHYRVRARNIVGDSPLSDNASGMTVCLAPTGLSAREDTSGNQVKVEVAWQGVPGASLYYVYRSTSPTSGYSQLPTTTGLWYRDANTAWDGTYYYKVRAWAASGYSAYSDYVVCARRFLDRPTNVTATDNLPDRIRVSWTAVAGATMYWVWAIYSLPHGDLDANYATSSNSYEQLGGAPASFQIQAVAGTRRSEYSSPAVTGSIPGTY